MHSSLRYIFFVFNDLMVIVWSRVYKKSFDLVSGDSLFCERSYLVQFFCLEKSCLVSRMFFETSLFGS